MGSSVYFIMCVRCPIADAKYGQDISSPVGNTHSQQSQQAAQAQQQSQQVLCYQVMVSTALTF